MKQVMRKYDGIILGSGIAALGCAMALARRNRKVLVISKKGVRGEATPASAGILDPFLEMKPGSPLLKMALAAFARYPAFLRFLLRKTGMRYDYARTGMFYAALSRADEKILRGRYQWQKNMGIPVRWVSRKELVKRVPDITSAARSAVFYPTIAKVNPRKLRFAMIRLLRKLGVRFLELSTSTGLLTDEKGVIGVRAGNRHYPASFVINAMGSWAGKNKLGGRKAPVLPVRGQILVLKGRISIPAMVHALNGAYIVPWGRNRYLVGSTVEFAGFKPHVTAVGLRSIQKRAQAMVPKISGLKRATTWAGLRPYSKDGMPFIGPVGPKGFYWATGYYRSGILMAPYAGELLVKGILTGKWHSVLVPFLPLRRRRRG
ncbi:MAG TPA: FAD-dependent oxidoreductase [bacterium]|nr:FAD-dependent oxidoreductase [bacterium]